MKKILFIPAPASGHVIPTFRIARILQNKGYSVSYLVTSNMKELIEQQGFEVIIAHSILFANHDAFGIFNQANKKIFDKILDRLSNITLKATLKNLLEYEKAITDFTPDYIFLDVFLSYNYLLQQNKIPTIFLQTMLSTYKDAKNLPLNSKILPINRFKVQFEWLKYKLNRSWEALQSLGDSKFGLTKRALKKLNRPFDPTQLTWDKCFHVGIKNIPEWVLSPIEFDFPNQKKFDFQYHIGPTIDLNRKEIQDIHFEHLIKKIEGKKIAYCSLGTISIQHNKRSAEFLKTVANVFSKKNDWELVISCGEIDVNTLGIVASNVHLFKNVPQLEVIKKSVFVITHGGLNTVMECILLGVPMLIFPLNDKWDQNGNAARVVYHQLGLTDNINKITKNELTKKIEELTINPKYKNNIFKMSRILQSHSDNLENIVHRLISNL